MTAIVHPTTGLPIKSEPRRPTPRAGLSGDYARAFPYDAANPYHNETDGWLPWIYSPDYEFNVYRDRVVGRSRDLARNDGWASGALDRILDHTVGAHWRFVSMPDYRALSTFNPKFDAEWASDYRHAFEAGWRGFTEDPNLYCDSTRQLGFTQQMRLALRQKLVDGDDLLICDWMPERIGYGAAKYATAFRLVDADRLSNPQEQIDTLTRRGGVELDGDAAPIGYHIRRAHQNDWYGAVPSMIWDYVERETDWGRRIVVHDFDRERPDQHRGRPVFAPILNRMKMLAKYDQVELKAAINNAIFSLFIQSPYDPEGLRAAADNSNDDDPTKWYWETRKGYRDEKPLQLDDVHVMTGFPGEKPEAINANRPGNGHDLFTHYVCRHAASHLGTTAEEFTQDWSKTNYSSARAGVIVALRTIRRRQVDFARNTALPCVVTWAEEWHDSKECRDVMPKSGMVPEFVEMRGAYARGRFLGPARGSIDPVKEGQADVLEMEAGTATLMDKCAERGTDWEEQIDQRSLELKRMRERGLQPMTWMQAVNMPTPQQSPEEKT